MPILRKGITITDLKRKGVAVHSAIRNAVQVYTRERVVITNYSIDTGVSVVPPPYDSEGYNYDDVAPEKTIEVGIPLGDVSDYSTLVIEWNNEGSSLSYGDIWCKYAMDEESNYTEVFSALNKSGTISVDISGFTGEHTIKFVLYAHSESSYRYYGCQSVINITRAVLTV